jgi:hypothetical protein
MRTEQKLRIACMAICVGSALISVGCALWILGALR